MVVGTCRVTLEIPGVASLKAKRSVVKPLIERAQNRFKVSIAEIDEQDRWNFAVLGIACVSNDRRVVNSILLAVVNWIEKAGTANLLDYEIEIW